MTSVTGATIKDCLQVRISATGIPTVAFLATVRTAAVATRPARVPQTPLDTRDPVVASFAITDTGADIPMISSSSGFIRQDEQYGRYMAGKSVENYVLLRRGEFAYNKGNSKRYEFGCVFQLETYEQGLVPHVYVCFALRKECDPTFYKYLFEADYLHDQLGALVNTGVRNNGLLNIRPADFMGVTVPLPSLTNQRRIAAIINTASDAVVCLERDLNALRVQKQALMQQLLTGKRRLRLPQSTNETAA